MTRRYYLLCALSGCLWAGVAWLIGHEMGRFLWGGVLASPIIGLIVGAVTLPTYRLSTWKRVWIMLLTLYVAAALFGLAIASYDLMFGDPSRGRMEGVLQTVLAVLWGITFTGYFVILWPLAYWNHKVVGNLAARGTSPPTA